MGFISMHGLKLNSASKAKNMKEIYKMKGYCNQLNVTLFCLGFLDEILWKATLTPHLC